MYNENKNHTWLGNIENGKAIKKKGYTKRLSLSITDPKEVSFLCCSLVSRHKFRSSLVLELSCMKDQENYVLQRTKACIKSVR